MLGWAGLDSILRPLPRDTPPQHQPGCEEAQATQGGCSRCPSRAPGGGPSGQHQPCKRASKREKCKTSEQPASERASEPPQLHGEQDPSVPAELCDSEVWCKPLTFGCQVQSSRGRGHEKPERWRAGASPGALWVTVRTQLGQVAGRCPAEDALSQCEV